MVIENHIHHDQISRFW